MIRKRIHILVLVLFVAGCAGSPKAITPAAVNQRPNGAGPTLATVAPDAGLTDTATAAPDDSSSATSQPEPTATAAPPTPAPTATRASDSGGLPDFSHVFIIVMENKEATQIVDSSAAPYLNSLAAQYARAANYYAVTHPSLPNYLTLTGGDNFGITTDCTQCTVSADGNIATQISAAGRTWKAYIESMPEPCYTGPDTSRYARRHNPFIYYDSVRTDPALCQNTVPLTQLDADIQANTLPDFVWISPNVCSDMHDCPVSTGDSWLKTWVPKILATPAWQDNGVLFIVFDEGTTNAGCCDVARGGKVDALVISPLVKPGFVSQVSYDHYSLLRTIEQSWGLPLLNNAAADWTPAMTDFFAHKP